MTAMKKSSAGGARGADGSAPRFFVPESFAAQGTVTVGEDAARHMRVLRLGPGSVVTLLDGQGGRASGTVRAVGKRSATITIERTEAVPAPLAMHALVPIADRERMLWLAEKASELALTSWRPVLWKRSRSVSPRGEGGGFQGKVRARMAAALEQSGNAWLPVIYPDATLDRALAALPDGTRLVLDPDGSPLALIDRRELAEPVVVAVGHEGGFEPPELESLTAAGFRRVSLGSTTLRFETAGVVALAEVRARLGLVGETE